MQSLKLSRRQFSSAIALSLGAATPMAALASTPRRTFQMFEALLYANHPDMRQFGLAPVRLVDRGIWTPGASQFDRPDPILIRDKLQAYPDDGAPLVMDFEFYDFSDEASIQRAVRGLSVIGEMVRTYAGNHPIGFYGHLPIRNYWSAVRPRNSERYRMWQTRNSLVAPLEEFVDMLFPSIYTFYDDVDGWSRYARAQIAEARRLSDKPVVPFIWPDYHSNGRRRGSTIPQIPGPFWRHQLETIHDNADGVVIWGGWGIGGRQEWDPSAPWWRETQDFMGRL